MKQQNRLETFRVLSEDNFEVITTLEANKEGKTYIIAANTKTSQEPIDDMQLDIAFFGQYKANVKYEKNKLGFVLYAINLDSGIDGTKLADATIKLTHYGITKSTTMPVKWRRKR